MIRVAILSFLAAVAVFVACNRPADTLHDDETRAVGAGPRARERADKALAQEVEAARAAEQLGNSVDENRQLLRDLQDRLNRLDQQVEQGELQARPEFDALVDALRVRMSLVLPTDAEGISEMEAAIDDLEGETVEVR